MRSDWTYTFRLAMVRIMLGVMLVVVVARCAALSTRPTGIPGCPNRTLWSDSAQRCIAREGR